MAICPSTNDQWSGYTVFNVRRSQFDETNRLSVPAGACRSRLPRLGALSLLLWPEVQALPPPSAPAGS